jgi:hypothetical protein
MSDKFGAALYDVLRGVGVSPDSLTASQVRYLLRFSSVERIRERLAAAGDRL